MEDKKTQYVYIVRQDWAVDEFDRGSDTSIHSTFEGASKAFRELTEQAKKAYGDYDADQVEQVGEDEMKNPHAGSWGFEIYRTGEYCNDNETITCNRLPVLG